MQQGLVWLVEQLDGILHILIVHSRLHIAKSCIRPNPYPISHPVVRDDTCRSVCEPTANIGEDVQQWGIHFMERMERLVRANLVHPWMHRSETSARPDGGKVPRDVRLSQAQGELCSPEAEEQQNVREGHPWRLEWLDRVVHAVVLHHGMSEPSHRSRRGAKADAHSIR